MIVLRTLDCHHRVDFGLGFLIEPHMIFPNMKGAAGIGTLPDGGLEAEGTRLG